MQGDYEKIRTRYRDVSTEYNTLTSTDYTTATTKISAKAKHTIYIQRILVSVSTAAAQAWFWQDNESTPVIYGTMPASQAGFFEIDFGPEGVGCGDSNPLNHLMGGTGVAAQVKIEAYMRPTPGLAGITPADL